MGDNGQGNTTDLFKSVIRQFPSTLADIYNIYNTGSTTQTPIPFSYPPVTTTNTAQIIPSILTAPTKAAVRPVHQCAECQTLTHDAVRSVGFIDYLLSHQIQLEVCHDKCLYKWVMNQYLPFAVQDKLDGATPEKPSLVAFLMSTQTAMPDQPTDDCDWCGTEGLIQVYMLITTNSGKSNKTKSFCSHQCLYEYAKKRI